MTPTEPRVEDGGEAARTSQQETKDQPSFLVSGGRLRVDGRSHVDANRRITETLGRLLQIKNLAVLIGAGASAHLGSPNIRDLSAKDILEMIEVISKPVPDGVSQVIENLAANGGLDLEKVLATLSAGIAYAQTVGASELPVNQELFSLKRLSEARRLVNLGLARACDLPNEDSLQDAHLKDPLRAHREFLRRLLRARREDLPRIRVFTTNYDLVIERTLDDAGVSYFDGFVGTVDRVFRPEVFEQDIYLPPRPTERTLTRLSDVLYLYKLHGSINWRTMKSAAGLGSDVVVQSSDLGNQEELAIIYPTPQKEADVLGYPYSELFRAFSNVVTAPETGLLIIGYGFSDDHINRFIFQALAAIPTFQLFVTSPSAIGARDDPNRGPGKSPLEEELTFSNSVAGRLAQLGDARVSVLAGPLGRFVEFATSALPDPDELTEEEPSMSDLPEQLSRVLQGDTGVTSSS